MGEETEEQKKDFSGEFLHQTIRTSGSVESCVTCTLRATEQETLNFTRQEEGEEEEEWRTSIYINNPKKELRQNKKQSREQNFFRHPDFVWE